MPLPEKALIEHIRRTARATKGAVRVGIGDDCAVLRPPAGQELLVTTDFSLEGIHFRREWHSPESVGHRCLTRGLSDIAAMGGEPIAAFLSLALPRNLPQAWVNRFLKGMSNLARRFKFQIAGGDTAESPAGVLADIMVLGSVPAGQAILRSGAQPGDYIYVTGELGRSAATLARLYADPRKKLNPRRHKPHFFPEPRLAVGRVLRQKKLATAMIDISDGLSTDLDHICQESNVGAEIYAAKIPRADKGHDLGLALHGGDDYELLFTAPPEKRIPRTLAGVPVTRIGLITASAGIVLADGSVTVNLEPKGWEHFGRR